VNNGFITGKSRVAGKGNFAAFDLPLGYDLGVGMSRRGSSGVDDKDIIRYDICTYTNHSNKPNVAVVREGNDYRFKTIKNVSAGDELFVDYRTFDFEGNRGFIRNSSLRRKQIEKLAIAKWKSVIGTLSET